MFCSEGASSCFFSLRALKRRASFAFPLALWFGKGLPTRTPSVCYSPALNSGEAEGCELWVLPNLPQTVLRSSELPFPRHPPNPALPPIHINQRQDNETWTHPTSPQPEDGKANHGDLIVSALRVCLSLPFFIF